MVHLETVKLQNEYFQQHKRAILEGNPNFKRFAMVHTNQVEYFKDKESLYKAYPNLAPEAEPVFGNFPMLVDIGKETNSVEYRKEQFKEREKKFNKDLAKLARENELLMIGRIELYD